MGIFLKPTSRWTAISFLFLLFWTVWDFRSTNSASSSGPSSSRLYQSNKHGRWRRESAATESTEFMLSTNPSPSHRLSNITSHDIRSAIRESDAIISQRINVLENHFHSEGVERELGTPAYFMGLSHRANWVTQNLSRISLISEETTRILAHQYGLSQEEIAYDLPNVDIRKTGLGKECPLKVDTPCQPRKYRAYDGFCNNVQHPRWGSANSRYLRYIMPDYADGVSSPRIASDGSGLPSPRSVSLGVHRDVDRPHSHLTALAPAWAEFISHDLVHTPQLSGQGGSGIKCCGVPLEDFHPECLPVVLPEDDPYYYGGERCQEYIRSSPAPRIGCTLGPREQMNQETGFLDASVIYGISKKGLESRRHFKGGLLRTQLNQAGEELLLPENNSAYCRASSLRCFKSGDDRVNENIGLTSLHLLFLREHNRLARELTQINPHWSDEVLFQEARRIVGAELQHITYSEFLPVILGESSMHTYGLKPELSGFYNGYNINTNAGILNGVATAARWYYASLMPKTMSMYDESGRRLDEKSIQESYSPFELYRVGAFEDVVRGLIRGKAQVEDQFINDVMTNKMFEAPQKDLGLGLDLAAQLIQAGRDHGIASYVHYRELCGLKRPRHFEDLEGIMSTDAIVSLQHLYKDVIDVDLFTGGLAEMSQEGATVGETFGCLLGLQFQKLRNGDRFWYENDLPPSGLSREQLHEIRKTSLARLICDNGGSVLQVQPRVFLSSDQFLNSPMACDGDMLPMIDLTNWFSEQPLMAVLSLEIRDAIQRAGIDLSDLQSQERSLWNANRNADPQSPAGTAFGFSKPKAQALEIANTSFLLQFATKRFLGGALSTMSPELQDGEAYSGRFREVRKLLHQLPAIDVSALTSLPKNERCGEHDLPCDHTTPYRSFSGWCNNLQDPDRGKAFRAFNRILSPEYQDGLQIPRFEAKNGQPLPSARLVSTKIHDDISRPHPQYSLMAMQFGQLLDHDLTHTPMNRGFGNTILDCSSCEAKDTVHPECWPIRIVDGDPHFPSFNKSTGLPNCLAFTRSLPGQLTLGYREQLNQVSAYIDASHTYGSDTCEAKKLRSFQGGRMNMTRHPGGNRFKDLLPLTSTHPECKAPSGLCFAAGDLRTSEQPGLTALHTVFTREHNRLAAELHGLNPDWDDETLYQEARRILSAINQHVVFAEWIPRVLGWATTHRYKLDLLSEGYSEAYDPLCDATIFNEFGSAALRFGHSLLKPSFKRYTPSFAPKEPNVQLRKTFFNPDILNTPGILDQILTGLIQTPMESLDNSITEEVTNHLFEKKRFPFSGMDLAALNIQRGRDHGLPSYNSFRQMCNLTRAKEFDDLSAEISGKLISKLKTLYPGVDDIDLFPGGLSETAVSGGLVGPTFACIIGSQFSILRKCDRFWYENGNSFTRFTPTQLGEIRKSSMARLMCDNLDEVKLIQRNALDVPERFMNPRVPCSALPRINLDFWRDRKYCEFEGKRIKVGEAARVSPCRMCRCTKEGPMCQSMKVENCVRLSLTFLANDILTDPVCQVQCSFVFRLLPLG